MLLVKINSAECKWKKFITKTLKSSFSYIMLSFILNYWARNVRKWSDWSLSEKKNSQQSDDTNPQMAKLNPLSSLQWLKTIPVQLDENLQWSHGRDKHNKKWPAICNSGGFWTKQLISSATLQSINIIGCMKKVHEKRMGWGGRYMHIILRVWTSW